MSLLAADIASEQLIRCTESLTKSLSSGCDVLRLDEQTNMPKGARGTMSPLKTTQKQARSVCPTPGTKKPAPNPTTPGRPVQKQKATSSVSTSPYFLRTAYSTEPSGAPTRRRKRLSSPIGSSARMCRKQTINVIGEILSIIEPPKLWWTVEGLPAKDAVSIAHFRAHPRLYYQLWLAKPTLIQESVSDDPWKLLIAVMLLNKTSGKSAIPIFWEILDRWPTPSLLSQADESELMNIIRGLGLQRTRSKRLILLSKMYLDDPPVVDNLRPSTFKLFGEQYKPTMVSHLPGSGAYALDSYRIFYSGSGCDPEEWKSVMPSDKELIRYLRWKWAFEQRKKWGPESGVIDDVDAEYLERLPCLLQK